ITMLYIYYANNISQKSIESTESIQNKVIQKEEIISAVEKELLVTDKFLVLCEGMKQSSDLLGYMQKQIDLNNSSELEKQIYENMFLFLKEERNYHIFENDLLVSLGEADGDNAIVERLYTQFYFDFFKNIDNKQDFDCNETFEKYYK
ncbi:MAG: hypothetical protein GY828_05855, partial [Candidatus Gracilibacteria bacterium]|nr:hypothetical protein [Candidatus Gracilibacteria bacterium]